MILLTFCLSTACVIQSKELAPNDVFVSVGEKELSDFDNWLIEYTDYVPSYIVLQDDIVKCIIPGGISVKEFKEKLVYDLDVQISDLPVNSLTQETNFREILPKGLNIIEVHMIGCEDCELADKKSTYEIRGAIDANFFRYYIRSSKKDVIDKYFAS